MIRIILTLFLLNSIICITIGQEISGIDRLEWKSIEHVKGLNTESINRIEAKRHEINEILWYDEESIGKCVVNFQSIGFNRKINQALQVKDTISTPFKINFRWFLADIPEDGSSFEKNYFISDSLTDAEIDLHTLTINNIIPIGFQIYFENNYFSSRMFTDSENGTVQYFYPINQLLKQEIFQNQVQGILSAQYKFTELDSWQNRELHELGEFFEVEIQYQYKMKNE
jgi:hypothetical protein